MVRETTPAYAFSSRIEAARKARMEHTLRRELGLFSTTMLVVGGIIGSGIFFTPSEVAKAVPSDGWILLAWIVGGVIAFAGALTFAELGALLPEAGGTYVYVREAFGKLPAFLYGWMTLLVIATAAEAAVAMGFGHYVSRLIPTAAIGGPMGVAIVTLVALVALNYFGIRPGAIAQNVLTVAKVAALAALIVGGLIMWNRVSGMPGVANPPAPRSNLLVGFAAAIVPVLFTIGGWQQMNMVAAEVKNPSRTIPRALLVGISIVVAVYLGANVVYLHALGRDGLAASPAVAGEAAVRYLGQAGNTFVSIAAAVSILGFLNVVLLATPRILYAMAKDGVFLQATARIHPRWNSPYRAVLLMGGWTLFLLLISRGRLDVLLGGVVFADWIFFGLGAASVFVLRRKFFDDERPYSVPGYPWVPAFFVLCAIGGVAAAIVAAPRSSLIGFGILLGGIGVYQLVTMRSPRAVTEETVASEPPEA